MKWIGCLALCEAATLLWQDADKLQGLLDTATFPNVSPQPQGAADEYSLEMVAPSLDGRLMTPESPAAPSSLQLAPQPQLLQQQQQQQQLLRQLSPQLLQQLPPQQP